MLVIFFSSLDIVPGVLEVSAANVFLIFSFLIYEQSHGGRPASKKGAWVGTYEALFEESKMLECLKSFLPDMFLALSIIQFADIAAPQSCH
jgi:hypothetical protein